MDILTTGITGTGIIRKRSDKPDGARRAFGVLRKFPDGSVFFQPCSVRLLGRTSIDRVDGKHPKQQMPLGSLA